MLLGLNVEMYLSGNEILIIVSEIEFFREKKMTVLVGKRCYCMERQVI